MVKHQQRRVDHDGWSAPLSAQATIDSLRRQADELEQEKTRLELELSPVVLLRKVRHKVLSSCQSLHQQTVMIDVVKLVCLSDPNVGRLYWDSGNACMGSYKAFNLPWRQAKAGCGIEEGGVKCRNIVDSHTLACRSHLHLPLVDGGHRSLLHSVCRQGGCDKRVIEW